MSYRTKVLGHIEALLRDHRPLSSALDFGSGEGWFAEQLTSKGLARNVVAVDVARRKKVYVEPLVYDGQRLPFEDRAFQCVYAIDVLHHCPDPETSLRDLVRCSSEYLLLKDHTFNSRLGWLALCALDEIGNRRFGVPSPYLYQRGWQWFEVLKQEGFVLEKLIHPARCNTGPMGLLVNRLQFLGLWRRQRS